ncbi:MAG: transporter, partial [Gammaproteobacteria bacterium HGW-Gammaproteobacteria-12]
MNIPSRSLLLASSLALAIAVASPGAMAESPSQDILEARQESQIETAYTLNRYLRDFDLKATVDNGTASL